MVWNSSSQFNVPQAIPFLFYAVACEAEDAMRYVLRNGLASRATYPMTF